MTTLLRGRSAATTGRVADPAEVARLQMRSVTVVTAGRTHAAGFCATSVAPVSSRPPVLSFAVERTTRSWAVIEESDHVLVHLLGEHQRDLALQFAGRRADKFGPGVAWHRGPYGLPQLDDVLACLALAVEQRFLFGSHALVVGRVVRATLSQTGVDRPLLHHRGEFCPPAGGLTDQNRS